MSQHRNNNQSNNKLDTVHKCYSKIDQTNNTLNLKKGKNMAWEDLL